MSEPESPAVAADAADPTAPVSEPAKPVKEPWVWTPERVLEWNRYYDFYVALLTLALVFIASAHLINTSTIWPRLQTGRLIAQQGPITRDPFSYTMQGQPWVNIPWVFDWLYAQVYDFGRTLGLGRPDQVAAGLIVGLTAIARLATAYLLLKLRRPGPGLWWTALCVAMALGVMILPSPGAVTPVLPLLGGVAEPAEVDPTTWSCLFLALEVFLLHRATNLGRPRALYALVPLFLVWANVHGWFLVGLALLACWTIGVLVQPRLPVPPSGPGRNRRAEPTASDLPQPSGVTALVVLILSALVVLANPSIAGIYPAAALPFLRLFDFSTTVITMDQLSFFGPESWKEFNRAYGGEESGGFVFYILAYVMLVGLGVASFLLNRRRFSLRRFLPFVLISVLFAALKVLAPLFAVVWAWVLALNGQEWYQDRYGTEGRASLGWRLWSVGGRSLTLVALTVMIFKGLTGYGSAFDEPIFGFGVNEDRFPFEAADFLANAKISGNILNLNLSSGDALIWRAWPLNPNRKPFIDGRENLYPTRLRVELQTVLKALADGDRDTWKEYLDRYNVTVVMLVPRGLFTEPGRTYKGLASSPDWIPIHDDGNVLLFGRADAPAEDLAFFLSKRLDAPNLAYKVERVVGSANRPPTQTSILDRYFRNRIRQSSQSHVKSAQRWLAVRWADPNQPPDIAHCLVAIGELRTALARNPDDPLAWRLLNETYRTLTANEAEITTKESGGIPRSLLMFRLQQRLTTLNFAILTTPPPEYAGERTSLGELHYELASLYLQTNALDLARDHFQAARGLLPADSWTDEDQARLDQLNEHVAQVSELLDRLTEETQAGPVELSAEAYARNCLGIAIERLDEIVAADLGQNVLKARLVDYYCQAGWPDRAFPLVDNSNSNLDDPALYSGPGTPSYRVGLLYFLIGTYDTSNALWLKAVRQVRDALSMEALESARSILRGQLREGGTLELQFPDRIATLAEWETELGLALLESGLPALAGEHLENALKVEPNLAARPLLAYYLAQIGRPVPPPREPGSEEPLPAPRKQELPENVFTSEAPETKPETPETPKP